MNTIYPASGGENKGGCVPGCGGVIAICLVALCFYSCGTQSNTPSANTTSSSTAKSTHAPAQTSDDDSDTSASLMPGDEGTLNDGGDPNLLVAQTFSDSQKVIDALVAKDNVGLSQMVASGAVYLAPSGSKAKVIGFGDGIMGASTYHIRMESGPNDGDDGWIQAEWMRK
jgi:hypothetical protein